MTKGQWSKGLGSFQDRSDSKAADELKAQSAVSLAQLGQLEEASHVLKDLRERYSQGQIPRISIRVLILESVIWYYSDRRPSALDRARRASALAAYAQIPDLVAESAVWVSHFAFNFAKYNLLSDAIQKSLSGFDRLGNTTKARSCLIIADSHQFLGSIETATRWYTAARIFARKAQDRSIVTAIEFNRIAMALSRLRMDRLISAESNQNLHKGWLSELLSIERLHAGFGINSLSDLLLLCEAVAYQLDNEFDQAAVALRRIEAAGSGAICGLSDRSLELEILWCNAMGSGVREVKASQLPSLDLISDWSFGEQLIALKQLDEICARIGLALNRNRLTELLREAIRQCSSDDENLKQSIADTDQYLAQIETLAREGVK